MEIWAYFVQSKASYHRLYKIGPNMYAELSAQNRPVALLTRLCYTFFIV